MKQISSIFIGICVIFIISLLIRRNIMEKFIPKDINSRFEYRRNLYQPYQVMDREIPFFEAEGQSSKFGQKTPNLNTIRKFMATVPIVAPLPGEIREVPSTRQNYLDNDEGFKITANEVSQISNGVFEKIGGALARLIRTNPTDYQCSHFDECEWELRDTRIYKIGEDNTRYYIDLQQIVFIPGKAWGYAIRTFSSWRKEPRWTSMILHRIYVEGLIMSNLIDLKDGYDPYALKNVEIEDRSLSIVRTGEERSPDIYPVLSPQGYTNETTETRVEFDKNTANRLEKLQFLQQKEETSRTGYQCYGKTAFTKFECERGLNNQGVQEAQGIWDRPCRYDYECPFYMANKNYPNYFGGCKKAEETQAGVCEMPIGIRRLGSKEYDSNDVRLSGLCRNCKPEDGAYCCEAQMKQEDYPDLQSPDWAFEGDMKQRANYRALFDKIGINLI